LSGIYYAQPDGSKIEEVSFGGTGYNGIGLSPDEQVVYAAETFTGRLIAFDLTAPARSPKAGAAGGLSVQRRGGRSSTASRCRPTAMSASLRLPTGSPR
jgi:gluconolactonase